ncbi:MAG TPA: proton-conducting transporter membrane subunit [Candidatus Polarisedimenticolia bacterium]|nr:proton-conducting transporter membrane subunit [Candidatus Polarisedimenticolia bacterium]
MGTVLVALVLLAAGGVGSLAASSRPRLATWIGSGSCAAACTLGLLTAFSSLGRPPLSLRHPWEVPYGEFALEVDPLSSFFLLILFGLCLLAAVYGAAYLSRDRTPRPLGPSWFFFNLLVASMALVVMARNGILFLVAWEGMALSSFFLVTFEDDKPAVREAGRLYLIASHVGTAFLLALFVALAAATGSMDFDRWRSAAELSSPASAGLLFLLAVVGFGTKAGLVPFHVWLPEAHPAAPSHVSAVMSGVMIKMGIYGLLRALAFLGPPPPWWGATLLGLGVASALVGALFALVQQDIKRLLAYSSVENVGLITIGLGLGVIGRSYDLPALAALGFAGALLHLLNHALFKGVLFLGAGVIAQQAGTRQIDRLGGLLKKMPVTGACILAGSAAITALPPFNGFAGEFLLYLGSFHGVMALPGAQGLLPLAALVGLALAGSLAAACFLRFSGLSLLGLSRGDAASLARDPSAPMRFSMVALAVSCLLLGLAPGLPLLIVEPAAAAAVPGVVPAGTLAGSVELAGRIPKVFALLILLVVALAWCRRRLLSRRDVSVAVTWDCGYERPTPRMQYTASSFGEPIREMFAMLLPARRRVVPPEGFFPARASFQSEVVRPFQERLYGPAFDAVSRGMSRLRWLHHGRAQLYVLYIVVTLILMLSWFLASQKAPL